MKTSIAPPDQNQLFDTLKAEIFSSLNCVKPGKISSIDLTNGSCTVEIVFKATIDNNQILSYPILVDCPVFYLQGAGAFIEMPIKKGDFCLVLFSDRDIDIWWATGNDNSVPNTSRKHSLSDGFALVGLNTKLNPLSLTGNPRFVGGSLKIDLLNNFQTASALFDNMFTQLEGLIDDISAIVTTGGQSLNAGSLAALATRKDSFVTAKNNFDQLFGSN